MQNELSTRSSQVEERIKVDAERIEIRQMKGHWEVADTWYGKDLGQTYICWSKERAFELCEEHFPGLNVICKRLKK